MTVRRTKRTKEIFNAGLPWSEAEEAHLIELYPISSNKDLSVKFGRPVWGIIGKARSLDLKKDYARGYRRQSCMNPMPWSENEEELLAELFSTTTNEEIGKKIGRSLDSIANKARKMGLRKIKFWSKEEDDMLKKLYRKLSYEQLALRLERTSGAMQIRIIVLGLESKVENWTEAESDFLRRNHHTMSYQAIAEHLGRTYGAVAARASRIGITKNSSSNKVNSKTAKSSPYIHGSGITRSHSFLGEVAVRCDKSIMYHY
jgi:hypothetical protein